VSPSLIFASAWLVILALYFGIALFEKCRDDKSFAQIVGGIAVALALIGAIAMTVWSLSVVTHHFCLRL
jgi:predicted small integral membrane protein